MAHGNKLPGPVNLGNPNELTVGDLVKRVIAITGSRSSVVNRPLPIDDPRRRRPDISRAAKYLKWVPKTSLDAGLKATVAWFAGEQGRDRETVRVPRVLNGAPGI
jgi:UDP-glucuronate decarboxylase